MMMALLLVSPSLTSSNNNGSTIDGRVVFFVDAFVSGLSLQQQPPSPPSSSRIRNLKTTTTTTTTTTPVLLLKAAPTEIIQDVVVSSSAAAAAAAATKSTTSSFLVAATTVAAAAAAADGNEKDFGELGKGVAIALVLGGGLIPALIGANTQMISTLSGRKGVDLQKDDDPNNTFDPYVASGNTNVDQFREYVYDSNAAGPDLPKSELLFAQDRISLVDVVAVLGRIRSVESMNVDWKNLPSATRGGSMAADASNPPMWLPRQAFKVAIRESPKWYGWPIDKRTGEPVGGSELKQAEEKRISKRGAVIADAALDVVFDSWSWGASIATPDKVQSTIRLFYDNGDDSEGNNSKGNRNTSPAVLDLDSFVNAAVRGRSNTAIAAVTFITIQVIALGSLFLKPLLSYI